MVIEHTFSHFEMVPAVMLGESFGIGTMIAWAPSVDMPFTNCWKGDEHHWEAVGPCTSRKLRRQVMGAATLRSGAITGCYIVLIGSRIVYFLQDCPSRLDQT